mmetsp:Transcript_18215/g.29613  ORF Transcript_18215/g.29613 Transcript_18215/m.29613 type:complete len:108 (-) Transcript_18215:154-477(-)
MVSATGRIRRHICISTSRKQTLNRKGNAIGGDTRRIGGSVRFGVGLAVGRGVLHSCHPKEWGMKEVLELRLHHLGTRQKPQHSSRTHLHAIDCNACFQCHLFPVARC